MSIIIPENYINETVVETPVMSEAKKAELVAKAKEILSVPLDSNDLQDALEYFCVYGRIPNIINNKPQIEGEYIPVEEGHTSEHYTSVQLKEVIDQVALDLTPNQE